MAALVTLAQVQAALPTVAISSTSEPTQSQVEGYIAAVSNEVLGLLGTTGAGVPASGDAAYDYLTQTVLEGVIAQTLRAKYAMAVEMPASVQLAIEGYAERLRRVVEMGRRIAQSGGAAAGSSVPLLAYGEGSPALGGSFSQWTERRGRDAGWRIVRPV